MNHAWFSFVLHFILSWYWFILSWYLYGVFLLCRYIEFPGCLTSDSDPGPYCFVMKVLNLGSSCESIIGVLNRVRALNDFYSLCTSHMFLSWDSPNEILLDPPWLFYWFPEYLSKGFIREWECLKNLWENLNFYKGDPSWSSYNHMGCTDYI